MSATLSSPLSFLSRGWYRPAAPLMLGLALLAGCKDDDKTVTPDPQPTSAYGTATPVGGGSARSYIISDGSGNPTEIGIRLNDAGMTFTATDTVQRMYELALPATKDKTPFDHLTLDWNPQGHPIVGVYTVPHFDAHFYMQSVTEQHAITLDNPKGDNFPALTHLPTGYVTDENTQPFRTIPMMGRHWLDSTSAELHGTPFTHTFIYGTYDGKVTFIEPMFTKAMLTTTVNVTQAIKQPEVYENTGKYFPMKYNIRYDAAAHEYVISLSEMVKR